MAFVSGLSSGIGMGTQGASGASSAAPSTNQAAANQAADH